MLRTCRKCGLRAETESDLLLFTRNRGSKYGYQNLCKRCNVSQHRAWAKDNTTRLQAYYRDYKNKHRDRYRKQKAEYLANNRNKIYDQRAQRRARFRDLPSESIDRQVVWARDLGCCHMCMGFVELDEFHLDHLIPISHEVDGHPGHVMVNVAVACPDCNLAKKDRWADWELVGLYRKLASESQSAHMSPGLHTLMNLSPNSSAQSAWTEVI